MPVGQAQAVGGSLIGAVDHAGIEPAGDGVDGVMVGRVDNRPGQRDKAASRVEDVDVVDAVGRHQIEVVVDELAPRVHEGGEAVRVGDVGIALPHDLVGNGARVDRLNRFGNAVSKMRRSHPCHVGGCRVEVLVVIGAVD